MPARFGVVGTGWRAQFYLRLARLLPTEREVVGIVGHTPDAVELAATRWDLPAYPSLEDLVASRRPDFIVSAAPWAVTPVVTQAAVAVEIPILCETPPAPDLEGLRSLWQSVGASGLVQVAEQYPLMPSHASRLALVRRGVKTFIRRDPQVATGSSIVLILIP